MVRRSYLLSQHGPSVNNTEKISGLVQQISKLSCSIPSAPRFANETEVSWPQREIDLQDETEDPNAYNEGVSIDWVS